ncbi:hypothetical protein D3C87_1571480 [compost metagenome]
MSITIKSKGKETVFISRYFFTKKFQGLGVLFDCDVTQGMLYETVLVVKIKILFFGFWMSIDRRSLKSSIKVNLNMGDIVSVLDGIKTNNQNRKIV